MGHASLRVPSVNRLSEWSRVVRILLDDFMLLFFEDFVCSALTHLLMLLLHSSLQNMNMSQKYNDEKSVLSWMSTRCHTSHLVCQPLTLLNSVDKFEKSLLPYSVKQ